MLYQGEEIKKLIPQREPIMMVDAFYESTDTEAKTGLTILPNNIFCEDGHFTEPGLIEHIAQSASAYAGYSAVKQNLPVPIGYIGEVKKFHVHSLPPIGAELHTTITYISEVNGITLISGVTEVNGEVVADTMMKIFIEGNK